jgi:hypothetical protein
MLGISVGATAQLNRVGASASAYGQYYQGFSSNINTGPTSRFVFRYMADLQVNDGANWGDLQPTPDIQGPATMQYRFALESPAAAEQATWLREEAWGTESRTVSTFTNDLTLAAELVDGSTSPWAFAPFNATLDMNRMHPYSYRMESSTSASQHISTHT